MMPTKTSAQRLVIAVSSRALFDLDEAAQVYDSKGVEAYRAYQRRRERQVLKPGVAFPFIRRLLAVNALAPESPPVEVVLVSRNDADTGLRVRNSLDHHGLDISRTIFTGGQAPWPYLDAFDSCLFLSAHQQDVEAAIHKGYAAGTVLKSTFPADDGRELRIAFDFDGVLADDEGELIYARKGLKAFQANERAKANRPLSAGPLQRLLKHIARLQRMETERIACDPTWRRSLRTAIITARSAPADRRVITTLRRWGIGVDEAFFIGDMAKAEILRHFRPHIFFDDKRANAELAADVVPAVHVPFGVNNL